MRILVLSDTHGDFGSMMQSIDAQPTAAIIIHCGDGRREVEELTEKFPDKQIIAVRGNCDWGSKLPYLQSIVVKGVKIFVTHGHLFQVKFTPYNLLRIAHENRANVVCFGHTHCALSEYEEGIHLLNPGSCYGYNASYGFIDITDNGDIVTNIVRLSQEV